MAESNESAARAIPAAPAPDASAAKSARADATLGRPAPRSETTVIAPGRVDAFAPRRGPGSPGEASNEGRRIAPRSPRAALEPERVPMPTRWSKSARHPLVIAGNAVFTILILLAIILGVGFAVGKHRFDAPGPLTEDKVVNIPPRYGIRDIADLLTKEGVIEHPLTFIAGSLLAKSHEELRFGEYQFTKHA